MNKIINLRIILTFSLVVLFFAGGLFLDWVASQRWITLSGEKSNAQANTELVEFAKKQTGDLNTSAKVAYDFSKITLGVLLTLLSASSTVARASRMAESRDPEV